MGERVAFPGEEAVVVFHDAAVAIGVVPDERVFGGEVFAGLGEDRREIFLPRALGFVGSGDEVDDGAAEGGFAFRRDGFVNHEETAVGTDTGGGIGGHERVGRAAVLADVHHGLIETRPRTGGIFRDRDADALVVAVNPVQGLGRHDAIADVAHIVEAEFSPDAEDRGVVGAGAVPEFFAAGGQDHLDVAVGAVGRVGDGAGDFRVRDPRVVAELRRPARVEEVVFSVVAAHGRAAPDAPVGVFKNGPGRDGLEPAAEIDVVAETGGRRRGLQVGAGGSETGGGETEKIAARQGEHRKTGGYFFA